MRIAEIVNTLEIGGLERLVVDLSLGLKARGHEPSLVCLRHTGPLAEPLRESGIEVFALEKGEGFSWAAARKLAAWLRGRRIEVVHTHNPLVHHYGVLGGRMAGVPAIVNTRHGLGDHPRIAKTETIFKVCSWMTDRIVAVCPSAREYFLHHTGVSGRKLAVIPNGIPVEKFLAITPLAAGPVFTFGAVGRLVPVKNHRMLLEAFAIVRRQRPQCRLRILGDGPLRAELEAFNRERGVGAEFCGASLDVAAFMSGLDAFVLCSDSEGLPLTVLEAMAAGLPVIASRVGGIPDLLGEGECGWLCPPAQPQRWAELMVRLVDAGDRASMGRQARARVLGSYSLTRMTENYESLFTELVSRRGRLHG